MSDLETLNKVIRSEKKNWKIKEIYALENRFPHSAVVYAKVILKDAFPDREFTIKQVQELLKEVFDE